MKNALELNENDFNRPEKNTVDLSSEIDAIWRRQQLERKQKMLKMIPDTRKNFMTAEQAELGKVYTICIEDEGQERYIKAEFITKGRNEFVSVSFFRRTLKGGKVLIHGIQNYSLIKETYVEPPERD